MSGRLAVPVDAPTLIVNRRRKKSSLVSKMSLLVTHFSGNLETTSAPFEEAVVVMRAAKTVNVIAMTRDGSVAPICAPVNTLADLVEGVRICLCDL